ncbi:hypothetical protein K438DRAFT_1945750, partial [Mycena galopus ATCC 62051]
MTDYLPPFAGSALFYSPIPILDANGESGPLMNVTGLGDGTPVPDVQIFRCSAEAVKPRVIVDAQSRRPIYIDQEMNNTPSVWAPVNASSDTSTDLNLGPEQALANN